MMYMFMVDKRAARLRRKEPSLRLPLHTDYALRALMHVGVKGDGLATIPEIVGHFDISCGHTMTSPINFSKASISETVSQDRRAGAADFAWPKPWRRLSGASGKLSEIFRIADGL